jgi:hypothetical protein
MRNIQSRPDKCECQTVIYNSPLKNYFAVKTCVPPPIGAMSLDLTKIGVYSKDSILLNSILIGEDRYKAHIYWKNDTILIIGEIREMPFFPDTILNKSMKNVNKVKVLFEERPVSYFIRKALESKDGFKATQEVSYSHFAYATYGFECRYTENNLDFKTIVMKYGELNKYFILLDGDTLGKGQLFD